MTLKMTYGTVTVTGGAKARTISGTGSTSVASGYTIALQPQSLALLTLGAGRTFQIDAPTASPGQVFITGPNKVQMVSGEVDLLAQLSATGEIDAAGLAVAGDAGTFRVDGGATPRVAVYAGSASASVGGQTLTIPAYRQVLDVGGQLCGGLVAECPPDPGPLEILAAGPNGQDVWDEAFLHDAIDLDSRLAAFAGGLDAQLGTAPVATLFRVVYPSSPDLAAVTPFGADSRSDLLIGWVIASAAEPRLGSGEFSVGDIFTVVMDLWQAGESWGTIASEIGVGPDVIFSGLNSAIQAAGISSSHPQPVLALPAPSPSPSSSPAVKPQASPSPVPSPSLSPSVAPSASPSPSPTGLIPSLLDPLTQLLGGVVNLLLPTPSPSPSPSR